MVGERRSTSQRPSSIILICILQLSMRVDCRFIKDVLTGDDATEIRVQLKEVLADAAGRDYRED